MDVLHHSTVSSPGIHYSEVCLSKNVGDKNQHRSISVSSLRPHQPVSQFGLLGPRPCQDWVDRTAVDDVVVGETKRDERDERRCTSEPRNSGGSQNPKELSNRWKWLLSKVVCASIQSMCQSYASQQVHGSSMCTLVWLGPKPNLFNTWKWTGKEGWACAATERYTKLAWPW